MLLVTLDVEHSRVVREIEVPGLLSLEPDPVFTFAIWRHHLPSGIAWQRLGLEPGLRRTGGVQRLHIRGGAHLTVAFALGAAVPTTSTWPVTVEDQAGAIWGEPVGQARGRRTPLQEESEPVGPSKDAGAPVAIYVDLVPSLPPGDAFAEYLAGQPGRYSRAIRLHLARREPIRPEAADILVADLGERMRGCAGVASTHRVHLFLRTPFPIAVLLGRTLNTLEVTLYEWDDTGDIPRYVKAATVAAGRGGGPVLLG